MRLGCNPSQCGRTRPRSILIVVVHQAPVPILVTPSSYGDGVNIASWSTSRSLVEVDAAVLERVQAKFESPGWQGPSTGLIDLDRLVGPLLPGTLMVVEGAAGSGRSTMLITVALANARKEMRTTFVSTHDA